MQLTSILSLNLLCPLLVASQAYNYGFDIEALTRRQGGNDSRIIVGRLPLSANGSLPLRPELRQMSSDPYKWNLFILALSMFQYVSQDDPLSWYQVAGIHGVPFQSWNGVEAAPGAATSGYCMHNSVLFPMWHRPYVALVEQEMFRMVNFIASLFTNSTERRLYQQAASVFRFPYWDWSTNAPDGVTQFPEVFWTPLIDQYGPNGIQTIKNPLYSYQFHPLDQDAMIWPPLRYWNETKRGPNLNVSTTDPPSRNDEVNAALQWKLPEIQDRLFALFSKYQDWGTFSNKAYTPGHNGTNLDSLEAIHDVIHMYAGLNGHMTYIPLSAFDPIFFLHHAMVDRLVSIWQIINPDAWITPTASGETSFNSPKGTIQYSGSPLTPFLVSQDGTFWDSNLARSTETFGYAYADTYSAALSMDQVRASLRRKIASWYGPARRYGGGPRTSAGGNGSTASSSLLKELDKRTEWVVNVRGNAMSVGKSLSVQFFLEGAGDNGRNELPLSKCRHSHLGSVDFAAAGMGTHSMSPVSGALPLTRRLTELVPLGMLEDTDPAAVVPFLESKLRFQVVDFGGGQELDAEQIGNLNIEVASSEVWGDSRLPAWGKEVTRLTLWPRSDESDAMP